MVGFGPFRILFLFVSPVYLVIVHKVNVDGILPDGHVIVDAVVPVMYGILDAAPLPLAFALVIPAVVAFLPLFLASYNILLACESAK